MSVSSGRGRWPHQYITVCNVNDFARLRLIAYARIKALRLRQVGRVLPAEVGNPARSSRSTLPQSELLLPRGAIPATSLHFEIMTLRNSYAQPLNAIFLLRDAK